MTARDYFDPAAGVWVAWYTEPNNRGETRRVFIHNVRPFASVISWTVFADHAIRFDTKAEALQAIAAAKPFRLPSGYQKGASRAADEVDE